MSRLSDRVDISISRETQTPSVASFGTPGIVAEFATSKTTVAFGRTRIYADLTEMITDGWLTTDEVYLQAQIIFQQNPSVSYIRVCRKNPATETWAEALAAIQIDSDDWYAFTTIATKKATVVFDGDFQASNSIVFKVDGVTCDAVVTGISQEATMAAIKEEIEGHSGLTDTIVTVSSTPFRTLTIERESGDVALVEVTITLGAGHPAETITYTVQDDILAIAAWTETQKKIYFVTSADSDIIASGSGDIFSQLKAFNYDRTVMCYHPTQTLFGIGWIGECLPFNFPSDSSPAQSWDCKTITGLTAYSLTSAQRGYVVGTTDSDQGKRGNIYTTTAGIDNTEKGIVASGENIEVIAGLDWLEARIQENVFTEKVQSRIIPMTNPGIQVIEGRVREILELGVSNGLIKEILSLTVPDEDDISDADKTVGLLEGVEFEITLARAIKKIKIRGRVTA